MPIKWTKQLDTGIGTIDEQHKKIVAYINDLETAQKSGNRAMVGTTLKECIDYTVSHFAFEESLQKEAGYEFRSAHKKVHELFTRRILEYQKSFRKGDDIGDELYDLLSRWLISHIQRDDADYVSAVKENMIHLINERKEKLGGNWLKRFFN